MNRWTLICPGIAITTLSTLILELSLTRIFSVVFYYHFAFLAISIALFGLGVGGILSYLVAGWRGSLFYKVGCLSALNSLAVVATAAVILSESTDLSDTRLATIYFVTALPFLFSGAIVSLVIAETVERVHQVYFWDLLGAGAGCLLLIPLLDWLGGPDTVLVTAVLYAAAAAVWFRIANSRAGTLAGITLALLMGGFLWFNTQSPVIEVRVAKAFKLRDEIFVRWNSFSRIAVRMEETWRNPAIFIDGDANTGISSIDIDQTPPHIRPALVDLKATALAYMVRPGAKSLIIGPGGGVDVAYAILSGSTDVTGVEINPIIANTIMRERFAARSHNLYLRPEVRMFVEDGRAFVRRSREKYQVIQATLVDTWASTAAGAFALSENNLYTTDAFYDYFTHLTDDGVLSFTRWGFEPPRESLRLVSLALEALHRLGEREVWKHVIVIREGTREQLLTTGAQDTVLIARKPLTAADVARARSTLKKGEREAVYLPGEPIASQFAELLLSRDPHAYQRSYPFDISPVSDNRPFFFYSVQPRDVWTFLGASSAPADYKINRAVPLLFSLLGVSVLATVLVLALPPLLLGARLPKERGVRSFLLYFACVGVAYILIEVSLIQKLVLFLGHPAYALTVVVFSLLVSSSFGSRFGARLRTVRLLPVLAATILVLALVLTPLLAAGVGLPMWMKVAITVILIAPAGFLMGVPFPSGLKLLEQWHPPSLRWAWSVNAASSVLGSAGSIFSALYLGLTQNLLIGSALYLCALLLLTRARSAR